jgi:hypothetical protein
MCTGGTTYIFNRPAADTQQQAQLCERSYHKPGETSDTTTKRHTCRFIQTVVLIHHRQSVSVYVCMELLRWYGMDSNYTGMYVCT